MEPAAKDATSPSPDIRRAFLAAARAGGIDSRPLTVLDSDQLDAPIDIASALRNTAPAVCGAMPTITGYRLLREISHGGQATVFQAIQESTGRPVAVKVIAGGPYVNARNRARFEREIKALAAVRHSNVAVILERGRTTDDSFFLVMDYVEGQCLDLQAAEWRNRDPSYARLILESFAKIARAMDAVHACGVVHRDLKPSNILIDTRGEPCILDFGLVRLLHESDGDPVHTVTGQIIGSLPWASPEQAAGQSAHLDARSDVYSLGVMLYHALTGRFPYTVGGSISQTLKNIETAAPLLASKVQRKWVGIDIRQVDAVLTKVLAKQPGDRYVSAAALADDLDLLLARKPTLAGLAKKPRKREKLIYLLAAVVLGGTATEMFLTRPAAETPVTVFQLREYRNTLGMKLLLIPAGEFKMGSDYQEEWRSPDEAQHMARVTSRFWVGKTEVTRGQYRALMENGGSRPDDDLPVVDVSWTDAVEFCRRLSAREGRTYRLPNEVEWEYACRAGSPAAISGTGNLKSMGWYDANSDGKIHAGGALSPNNWGLYDMHGGVGEWCDGEYNRSNGLNYDSNPQSRPADLLTRRPIRGGSFKQPYSACRSGARYYFQAEARLDDVGFRVAMNP